jgi:hypothetical protein
VLSTLAANHTSSEIDSGTLAARARPDGFQLQFGVGGLFCLIGVVAAVVLLRPQQAEETEAGAPIAKPSELDWWEGPHPSLTARRPGCR